MRPLAVLLLVIAAVGALVLALFTVIGAGGSKDRTGNVVLHQGQGRVADGPAQNAAATLEQGPTATATQIKPVQDISATQNPSREGLGQGGSWSNEVVVTVLDPSGKSVQGAKVTFVRQSVPTHLALLQIASGEGADYKPLYSTTHEDGTANFSNVEPANDWTIAVEHPEHAFKEIPNIQVARSGHTTRTVQLGEGLSCHGWVLDIGGAPIEGAQLELMSQIAAHLPGVDPRAHRDTLRAETDSTGYYEFTNVAPGNRNLTAHADGFGRQTRNNLVFSAGKDLTVIDFKLQAGLCIAGRVFGPDLLGIEGAHIEAISYQTAISSKGVTTSQADGHFEVCDLSEGAYVIILRSPGYKENREHTRVDAGEANLQIQMARLGSVMGRVVDGTTGDPLKGAFRVQVRQVSTNAAVYGRAMRSEAFDNSSGTGEFEVSGLDEATFVVQGIAAGYAPTFSDTFTIAQGMTTPNVEVRMSRGGLIQGQVVDAATRAPVAGARIATFDNSYVKNPFTDMLGGMIPRMTADVKTVTDEDGYFELAGLNQETYQLQILSSSHATKILKDRLVLDGSTDDLGTISLSRGAEIRGTVYDAAGQPLAGAEVQMNAQGGGPNLGRSFRASTDSNGRYHLANINEGSYKITAVRGDDGGNPFEKILDMKNSETSLTVSEGSNYQRDLHLGG